MNETVTCRETLAVTVHRVLESDLNEHHTVYGGRLLEMIDGTASIASARLAREGTVTASVDNLNFIKPFVIQDSFCIEAYVSGVGSRSIEVFVKVIGEHLNTGERFLGLTAFLTFVVPNKTKDLRPIVPVTPEEKLVCDGYPERVAKRKANFKAQKEFNENLTLTFPWDFQ